MKHICHILLLLVFSTGSLYAQHTSGKPKTYSLIFKGNSIQRALQRLVKTTTIDLAYDPAIMSDRTVYATAKKKSAEDILRLILKGSSLDFIQLSSGTYVIVSAPQKTKSYGNLSGRVIDRGTGEPLDGANVMLADASGGAATNKNGYFTIPQLQGGDHPITISYVGYKPVRDTVWIPADATASLNFSMASKPVLVEPIVVEDIQNKRPVLGLLNQSLQPSQITRQQSLGTADAVKSMANLSGINFRLPLADFNIQGGSNGEHQLRLDNVPIYNPESMGQLLGAFSPWAVRKIEIHKAGFGAPLGSQLSGVVNVVQEVGNTSDPTYLFQINPQNMNGRYNQKFDIHNGPSVKLMLAGRTSIWRWYQQPATKHMLQNWDQLDPLLTRNLFQPDSSDTYRKTQDHSYDINYYDLHAAVKIEHNKFHQTKVSAYFGKNILETDLTSEKVKFATAEPSPNQYFSLDHYKWTNYMAKVAHHWLMTAQLDADFSGYITHHAFNHNYILTQNRGFNFSSVSLDAAQATLEHDPVYRNTGDKNALTQSSARLKLNYETSKNYTLSGGVRVTNINYQFNLSDLYYNASRSHNKSFLVSGYVQNDFLLTRKTSLSVGTRMTFVPSRDLVFAEPRAALKFDASSSDFGSFSVKLSGGIYRQYINQFDVSNVGPSTLVPSLKFWVPIDYSTTVPKAYHLALQNLWQPAKHWEIRAGSYYKWIPDRLTLNYNKLAGFPFLSGSSESEKQHQFISAAKGYAYGAGLSIKKFIPSLNLQLKGDYQYSVARQRIASRFGGSYQPLPSSQPQKLDASLNWRIIPDFMLLLNWHGIWGRTWGYRKAYYDYLSVRENKFYGKNAFDNPGGDHLPRYSQLNAGASYQTNIGSSRLQFRLDVFNLLNHKNLLNWWLSPYNNPSESLSYRRHKRKMTGFRPSLSIRLSY